MKLDTLFRFGSTLLNSNLFISILYIKLFFDKKSHIASLSNPYTILFLSSSFVLFFIIFSKTISDKNKKSRIYSYKYFSYDESSNIIQISKFFKYLKETDLPNEVRKEIVHRIEYSIEIFGKEETLKNLINQYQVCIENERFYEKIAWQIGSIFVPVSLTLSGLGLTKQVPSSFPIISGFALFATWVLLFNRFRASIRLYRDCAKLIEGMLGMFSVSYVYDFLFEKYGAVVRVWPYLVTLSGFYFNFAIYSLL